jgi:hypothetical protein
MLSANDEERIKKLEDRISYLEELGEVMPPKAEKWYENIPEGGVLCFCWDKYESDKCVDRVTAYSDGWFVGGESWKEATPLTKQEIQVFMDNAPEK